MKHKIDKLEKIISLETFSQELSPSSFISLVNEKIELIKNDRDVSCPARAKPTPKIKKFYEEILPTSRLLTAKREIWGELSIKHHTGNQNFDFEILGHKTIRFLEVTHASMNYNEHLQNEKLNQDGFASGYCTYSRDSSGKIVETGPGSKWGNEILTETLEDIKKAFERKSKKKYRDKTSLLIYFDDGCPCLRNNKESLSWEFERLILNKNKFSAIFIVGYSASLWEKSD
jgi:hypothetical protein